MGYILKELEQQGPIQGRQWQMLATDVIHAFMQEHGQTASPYPEVSEKWVASFAQHKGWSASDIRVLRSEFHQRNLSSIAVWHGYATAHPHRMGFDEALVHFKKALAFVEKHQGQVHPCFKIESIYVYGSFARKFNPEKPYGDLDLMADIRWTGPENASEEEKMSTWKEWTHAQQPFGERISMGSTREFLSTARQCLHQSPSERRWQAIHVWESPVSISQELDPQEKSIGAQSKGVSWFHQCSIEDKNMLNQMSEETFKNQSEAWQQQVGTDVVNAKERLGLKSERWFGTGHKNSAFCAQDATVEQALGYAQENMKKRNVDKKIPAQHSLQLSNKPR